MLEDMLMLSMVQNHELKINMETDWNTIFFLEDGKKQKIQNLLTLSGVLANPKNEKASPTQFGDVTCVILKNQSKLTF